MGPPSPITSPRAEALIWLSGTAVFLATHLFALARVAGFHYDEAWAALFARRIAVEPSFWPIRAMSPYASAWSHYVAAFFFKIFGTNLFIFRASGIALVLAGVVLLSSALARLGERRAAALFPWVVAFFPATVFNHRFAIEISTFHVFCLGLLCWGTTLPFPALATVVVCSAALLGITSHVLFLAPALALFLVALFRGTFERGLVTRTLTGVALGAVFFFFVRIHLSIPEKDKSLALMVLPPLCAAALVFPRQIREASVRSWKRIPRVLTRGVIAAILALPLFFLGVFAEGSWSAAYFNGGQDSPFALAWPLAGLALGLIAAYEDRPREPWLDTSIAWAALTTLLTAALATKPAPRYFEIPLLLLATGFAVALSRSRSPCWARSAAAVWVVGGSLQLALNYWIPGLRGAVPERDVRFLFFHDSSSDTLPKQELALSLAGAGCRFEQIVSDDIRVLEPLRFLSAGDWPIQNSRCEFGERVRVARLSQTGSANPPTLRVGAFGIWVMAPTSQYSIQ